MIRKKLFGKASSRKSSSNANGSKTKSNRKYLSKSKNSNALQTNFEAINKGQKHRAVVTQLLSMTLTREVETDLLWIVAKGFDLPLVIGEQFICKTNKFQSASYHACLELITNNYICTQTSSPFICFLWRFNSTLNQV